MDRETVKVTLLAEALEMSRNSYVEYRTLEGLESFFDRSTAIELAKGLKDGFSLEIPLEVIMSNGFFRGYLAGLMLSDKTTSHVVKEKIAKILLEDLLRTLNEAEETSPGQEESFQSERDLKKRFYSLFEEKEREESGGLVRENLSLFRHFMNSKHFIPIYLWGNELTTFICESLDSEQFEGSLKEDLRKIVPFVLASYSMPDTMGSSVGLRLPSVESYLSSQFPILAMIRNRKLNLDQVTEFIKSLSHIIFGDILLAPVSMAAGGKTEEKARAKLIINKMFASMSDSELGIMLNSSSYESRDGFLYEVVVCNDFSKVFDRLKNVLKGIEKKASLFSNMAIASALLDKDEAIDWVVEYVAYLKTLEPTIAVVRSGLLLCMKYDLEDEELFSEKFSEITDEKPDPPLIRSLLRDSFGDLDVIYENMADEYSHRTAIDGVISNLKSIKEPNFISFEKTGSLEYSRVPMYTLINSVISQNDIDHAFDTLVAYCKRYRFNFEFMNTLLFLSTGETDELKKLLHVEGELALKVLHDIVEKDKWASLIENEESPSNTELLQVIEHYVDSLIDRKDYREALRVIEEVFPLVGPDDYGYLLASKLLVCWRLNMFDELAKTMESNNHSGHPKALAVLALKNYAYRELDRAEQILLKILRHFPDFIKYLLEEEENDKKGFEKAERGNLRSQKRVDSLTLAEEFRGDWLNLRGGKEWLKRVQKVFEEVRDGSNLPKNLDSSSW
ncbi:hypothetical protein [Mesotoga prima]|uniref:hypothetical protein n=1 Tax=Mesotoga prima TaxID=1184387 RepID=UPI002BE6409B|nr:hypothetical protein [Mesotoga prima]HQN61846.1 hypothetical protein [Mesotoga prima]